MDDSRNILYVDMLLGERIQEMKLAGIRRYANMRGWNIVILSEGESRPEQLAKTLAHKKPVGCIVECSAAHSDLPPRFFGGLPVVYLDCARNLYGGRMPKVMHNGEATTRMAFVSWPQTIQRRMRSWATGSLGHGQASASGRSVRLRAEGIPRRGTSSIPRI